MSKFQILCSCIKCKRETTTGQLTRNHIDVCPEPKQDVRFPRNIGRNAWNKGLTIEDPRVKSVLMLNVVNVK